VIAKVLGVLMPVVPALFDCSARTVYVPYANSLIGATAQLPPEAVVASVCTGEPETPDPEKTSSVIFDESPGAVPAVPENPGLRSCVVLPLIGFFTVTAGATGGTVHDMRAGVRSAAPDALIARTAKACGPPTRAAYRFGLLQGSHGAASRLHSNVPAPIVEPNRITAVDRLLRLATPVRMIVFGAGPDAGRDLLVATVSLAPDQQFPCGVNRLI
jgi:hypothetical protein